MQRKRIHDAHTFLCANFDYQSLEQIDLFVGDVDTITPIPCTPIITTTTLPTKDILKAIHDAADSLAIFAQAALTDNPDYQRGFIIQSQLQLDHLVRLSNLLTLALKVAAISTDMRKREVQP